MDFSILKKSESWKFIFEKGYILGLPFNPHFSANSCLAACMFHGEGMDIL